MSRAPSGRLALRSSCRCVDRNDYGLFLSRPTTSFRRPAQSCGGGFSGVAAGYGTRLTLTPLPVIVPG